jgi:hypothetical protein
VTSLASSARARALAAHPDPKVSERAADALSPSSLVTRAFEGAVEVRARRYTLCWMT